MRYSPVLTAGTYDVYVFWNSAIDRASAAPVIVKANGVRHYNEVDMRQNGGVWNLIGTYAFTGSQDDNNAVFIKNQQDSGTFVDGYIISDAVAFVAPGTSPNDLHDYTIKLDQPKQVIWGLGVEIQSDSIGSGNNGLPNNNVSVPHDLVQSERVRLAEELIGRGAGFRYIRLAGGLYYRGLTPDSKNLIERWPEQLEELQEMIQISGAEGINFEYWSVPPGWKDNGSYLGGGTLASFDTPFLNDFADSVVQDLQYLEANGIPVVAFGLQNEAPHTVTKYPHTRYTDEDYIAAFNIVAPKVRAAFPNIHIHANSWDGQNNTTLRTGLDLNYVDAWTWHRIGNDSNEQITNPMFNANKLGKDVYNNEFEYLSGGTSEARMLNTAQSIMNWMTFVDSPTWYWLHALKPTYNAEAEGYALGYWRPQDDDDFSKFSNIQKGHFDYELRNWRAIVGFLEWMPWDSQRYHVDEADVRNNQRIMAFRQGGSSGKLVIVTTNRGSSNFEFEIDTSTSGTFKGYRYSLTDWKNHVGTQTTNAAGLISPTLPTMSIEFWVEQ